MHFLFTRLDLIFTFIVDRWQRRRVSDTRRRFHQPNRRPQLMTRQTNTCSIVSTLSPAKANFVKLIRFSIAHRFRGARILLQKKKKSSCRFIVANYSFSRGDRNTKEKRKDQLRRDHSHSEHNTRTKKKREGEREHAKRTGSFPSFAKIVAVLIYFYRFCLSCAARCLFSNSRDSIMFG